MSSPEDRAALLPCPFCGGDAEMDTRQGYEYTRAGVHRIGNRVTIYCRECPADLGICREDVPEYSTDDLIANVTEMWNKRALRAAPAVPREPTEEMEEAAALVMRNYRRVESVSDAVLADSLWSVMCGAAPTKPADDKPVAYVYDRIERPFDTMFSRTRWIDSWRKEWKETPLYAAPGASHGQSTTG